MKPVRFSIAVAAAVALAAGSAQATMCVKKSGAVVVRDTCRKKETAMSTADFVGAPGPAGADGAAGPRGAKGEKGEKGDPGDFRVVDSTGKLVGIVDVGHSDSIAVTVPNVGTAVLFSDKDDPTGFYQEEAQLFHESVGCQGAPLAQTSRYNVIPYIDAFANTAYFPDGEGSVRTILSEEYATTSCGTFITTRGLCCTDYTSPDDIRVAPVIPVALSTLGTPPFHVAH